MKALILRDVRQDLANFARKLESDWFAIRHVRIVVVHLVLASIERDLPLNLISPEKRQKFCEAGLTIV